MTADIKPSGKDIIIVQIIEAIVKIIVAGSFSIKIEKTGLPETKDLPISPDNVFFSQIPYCTTNGLSKLSSARNFAFVSADNAVPRLVSIISTVSPATT